MDPKGWPFRCPKPLEAEQELFIQYLSSGRGYDDQSVALAVQEGNSLFEQKEFRGACDAFGIAYELGRHHHPYRALLHDLLLRRILCHSLLGRSERATEELEKASWLIPHEATGRLIAGLVHSKAGAVAEANTAFQQAVAAQRELKDLVDCLVAYFCLQHSRADRAIQICTQVLQRSPRYSFALLVRGDSYKFGQMGRASREKAAADYADLLEMDLNYQSLICRQSPENPCRAEELLLSFHPTLQLATPKAYHLYACCRRKDPLVVCCMVVLAVTKLRLLTSSGKVVREVQEAYEQLLEQRAELQRKVHSLIHAQKQAMPSPLATQVYGPLDPENPHSRRYRRYWMEQTVPVKPPEAWAPQATCSKRRQQALLLAQQDAEALPCRAPAPEPVAPTTEPRAFTPALPEPCGRGEPKEVEEPRRVEDPHKTITEPVVPPRPLAPEPPKASPTQGWDEEQWLCKAKQLLMNFGLEQPSPPKVPSSPSFPKGGPHSKLLQKLEQHGLSYLHDWYTAVDRVHKVRDMAICRAPVEPPVAVNGLLGVPGHSYVVPKRPTLPRSSSQERRPRRR